MRLLNIFFKGSALKENYVFNSLDERDIKVLVNAMTIVQKSQGDNVVEQGLLL